MTALAGTWTLVGTVHDIPLLEGRSTTVDGRRIAVFRLLDGFAAIDAHCPHAAGPLADGIVADSCVTCPLHGRRFDLQTGESNGAGERRRPRGPRRGRRALGPARVKTTCPYCGVGCGLVAEVRDGRLAAVRGDAEHPVNRGATCRKPTRLPEAVHAPDRATAADVARVDSTSAGARAAGARCSAPSADKLQSVQAPRRSRSTSPASC